MLIGDPHWLVYAPFILGWAMTLIPCNDPPSMTQYCLFFAPPNQTFQEVTYPDITLAEARLTAKLIGSWSS
jgi:hypothetical protein